MTKLDPFQSLWTHQPQEPFTMSLDEIHVRARRFRSRIRIRNLTEYAASIIVIGVFGWIALLIPQPAVKAGAVLNALAAAFVAWSLHRRAGAGGALPDGTRPLGDYHRAELVKQRNALAGVWLWYLAPFVPGILVFVGATSFAPETGMPLVARLIEFGAAIGLCAAIFLAIHWLNMRAVEQIDAEIAALDKARGD